MNLQYGRSEFAALGERLEEIFDHEPGPRRTRTIVVIPSFSVDNDLLVHSPELQFWEHRMLYLVARLRNSAVSVIYVSSQEISKTALNYYLNLIPGLSADDLPRLTLVACRNTSGEALAKEMLRQPNLLQQLRDAIRLTDDAYIECFTCTDAERDLALALDVPIYGSDPALNRFGSKSQSKQIFRELKLPTPDGVEGVRGLNQLVNALADLKLRQPNLKAAIIKLEDSLGGVGNARFSYSGCPGPADLTEWVQHELESRLNLAMPVLGLNRFLERVSAEGCIVESYIDGRSWRSPSVQCEIRPDGELLIASSHDQLLTGAARQHFSGCSFPAMEATQVQDATILIGNRLRSEGVVGWFGVDFVATKDGFKSQNFALEINLRSLGTVHHLRTLETLTGGSYDSESGHFVTERGEIRCYLGSDSIVVPDAENREVSSLVAELAGRAWAYDTSSEIGVVLHMIDALGPHGRLGLTCIGRTLGESHVLFTRAVGDLHARSSLIQASQRAES